MVADSHHFDEEQVPDPDPDPDPRQSEKLDPELHYCKLMRIGNPGFFYEQK